MNRCSLVASPAQSYQHIFKLDSGFPQKESPEPFGGLYPAKKGTAKRCLFISNL
jgi:hypothetical protein